jgi:hypothetical protein
MEIPKPNIVSVVGQGDSEAYINPRCTNLNVRLEARGNNLRVEINTRDESYRNMSMILL